MIVLKLGGSLITEKDRPETLDGDALERAAEAIAETGGGTDLVVVHGGGSFGHHHAERHGVSPASGTDDAAAVAEIHGTMTTLNRFVLEALLDRDVPAVPVQPLSMTRRDENGALHVEASAVATLVREGFVPVLHGDVIATARAGVTVCSGDALVVTLARALEADRVGLCATVPGVLDEAGAVVDRIDSLETVEALLGPTDGTDVTGGMRGKVERLLESETPGSVFGLDALPAFLAGEVVGTTVAAEPSR